MQTIRDWQGLEPKQEKGRVVQSSPQHPVIPLLLSISNRDKKPTSLQIRTWLLSALLEFLSPRAWKWPFDNILRGQRAPAVFGVQWQQDVISWLKCKEENFGNGVRDSTLLPSLGDFRVWHLSYTRGRHRVAFLLHGSVEHVSHFWTTSHLAQCSNWVVSFCASRWDEGGNVRKVTRKIHSSPHFWEEKKNASSEGSFVMKAFC